MLEMAILETQIFKTFWGSIPPDPPRKLGPRARCYPSLLKILDPPLRTPLIQTIFLSPWDFELTGSNRTGAYFR